MKILIAGSTGLVGSHLARRLAKDHEVLALRHADLDITDQQSVQRLVGANRPQLIFNCAVLQVDESEQDPALAWAVNVNGPRHLAAAANGVGAEIVQFSSQYVFAGGQINRPPYTVDDEPAPINVYGRSKLAGEHAVRDANPRAYIIRTSWVYGSGKNSFLCAAPSDLRAGKKVRAIDDIWSSTTYVADLIERILLIQSTGSYGTYHVVNQGVCSYYEFALEAGRLLGLNRAALEPLIEATHERDMKRMAVRPVYTPLRCLLSEKLALPPMRHWHDALAAYVKS